MKKIFLIVTILCSFLVCGICSAAPAKQKGMVIETDYYTITVPASWKTDCVYEAKDDYELSGAHSLDFYEKSSCQKTEYGLSGGELFSIYLTGIYDDYTKWDNYQHLGSVTVDGDVIGTFNVVAVSHDYKSNTAKTAAKYKSLQKQIPAVIKSIKYKKGITYSKEAMPFYEPEEDQAYEDANYEEEEVEQEETKESIEQKAKKEIASFLGKLFK